MSKVILDQYSKLTLSEQPIRRKPPIRSGKPRSIDEVPAKLWQVIKDMCDGLHKWPLFIHGTTGTGKTSAALCAFDRVEVAKFYTLPELADYSLSVKNGKEYWSNVSEGGPLNTRNHWNRIRSLHLLVIDDIGIREYHDDFQAETLFNALEAREGKPLICTSNLDAKGIEEFYHSRISSRLCSGKIHQLGGDDRRFEGAE